MKRHALNASASIRSADVELTFITGQDGVGDPAMAAAL
jgi:hypothetical protein